MALVTVSPAEVGAATQRKDGGHVCFTLGRPELRRSPAVTSGLSLVDISEGRLAPCISNLADLELPSAF